MKTNYTLIYSIRAIEDIKETSRWYEFQQKGLGKRFKGEVLNVISIIKQNPFFASVKYADIRTAACKIFPYAIHYEVEEENKIVRIISIFHFSRKPGWME